jgi:dihydrofolate reductase
MITALVHCDKNGLIGVDGKLAYTSLEDLREFKKLTVGDNKVLVMGKRTYEECGNLAGRTILTLSSEGNLLNGQPTTETFNSLRVNNDILICGGEIVYKTYLPCCDAVIVHLTKQETLLRSGTMFPWLVLVDLFTPVLTREFDTFTQVVYNRND